MGRPAFSPTPDQRKQVEAFAAYGIPEDEIAGVVGIDPKTLRKHFRNELDTGMVKANARVAESLFLQAVGAAAQYDKEGNLLRSEQPRVASVGIFWAKCRMGWSEYRAPERSPKPTKLGKKEAAQVAAETAGNDSDWGQLVRH